MANLLNAAMRRNHRQPRNQTQYCQPEEDARRSSGLHQQDSYDQHILTDTIKNGKHFKLGKDVQVDLVFKQRQKLLSGDIRLLEIKATVEAHIHALSVLQIWCLHISVDQSALGG